MIPHPILIILFILSSHKLEQQSESDRINGMDRIESSKQYELVFNPVNHVNPVQSLFRQDVQDEHDEDTQENVSSFRPVNPVHPVKL